MHLTSNKTNAHCVRSDAFSTRPFVGRYAYQGSMRYLLSLLFLVPIISFAGIPTELAPDQLDEMGIEVLLWYEESPRYIKEHKEHALCSSITILFPLIGIEEPTYTKAKARSILKISGKVLTHPNVLVYKTRDEKRNEAVVCLPLGAEYEADIIFSYNPPDPDLSPMCTPSFILRDIRRFLKK